MFLCSPERFSSGTGMALRITGGENRKPIQAGLRLAWRSPFPRVCLLSLFNACVSRSLTSGSAYMSDTGKFSSESWTPAGESTVLYQPHLIERHRYDEDTTTSEGTGSRQTTRSRVYHSGELARANETTTHPTVSGANLGSGVATLRKNYRDTNGRVTFSRDEVDVVSYILD